MKAYVNFNGELISDQKVSISINNRSFRYGDGFFETMKFLHGRIILQQYHYERLLMSLRRLQFNTPEHFNVANMCRQVEELVLKNKQPVARVRLMVYRGDGGLYDAVDNHPYYLIQSWPLIPSSIAFNKGGLIAGIYGEARKTPDQFSNIKSNNFLPYVMGAIYAQQHKLNDCILLNSFGHIADATIANVFIVKGNIIKTPPLSDGPVGGVMRKYLLDCFKDTGIPVNEVSLTADDLYESDEVFLTNAVYGIRWVKTMGSARFKCEVAREVYQRFIAPLNNNTTIQDLPGL